MKIHTTNTTTILFSRGVTEGCRNHRGTATLLARHEDIVVIPQHAKGQWAGTTRAVAVAEHRIAELYLAFISPLPKWLFKKDHIPVVIDPDGFDRRQFLQESNTNIRTFFQQNLPTSQAGYE